MDALVLGLASGGLGTTAGATGYATVDIMRRVRRYRRETRTDDQPEPPLTAHDAYLRVVARRLSFLVAAELDDEREERTQADRQLAALAGATSNLRNLVVSGLVAVAGVLLSGAADIVAAAHAR